MKVLHVGYCCTHGGAESVVAGLCREQVRQGFDVEVAFEVDHGAAVQFDGICPVRFLNQETLAEHILRNDFDVIHAVTHAAHWLAPAIRASRYAGGLIVTSHACGFHETTLDADIAVAVSQAVFDSIHPIYGDKLRVIPNGIDAGVFFPPAGTLKTNPTVAWVGRSDDPLKGLDLFLDFLQSPAASEFGIAVVDGAPTGLGCRGLLPEATDYQGRKNWGDMPAFWRSVRETRGCLLSTSRMEAMPMTVLEAQACGCPVIAPAVGGIPEVIEHEKTGYLYDRDSGVAGITEALNWLYARQHYDTASVGASNAIAERFSARRMSDEYHAIYLEALRMHPKARRPGLASRKGALVALMIKRRSNLLVGVLRRLPLSKSVSAACRQWVLRCSSAARRRT